MTDCHDADCLVVVSELIDDAIRPHTQRAEAPQPAAQRVSDVGVPLEQSKRVLDRVDQRPTKVD